MVNVYNFKLWDAGCGIWVYPIFKTTSDRIKEARGKILVGTNEKVDPSMLGVDGQYFSVQAKIGRPNRKDAQKAGRSAVRAA